MPGVQIVSEYRGSWRFAHPAAEPVSLSDSTPINPKDVAVNMSPGLQNQRGLSRSIEERNLIPAHAFGILGR